MIEQYLASGEIPSDPAVLAQLLEEANGGALVDESVEANNLDESKKDSDNEKASAATSANTQANINANEEKEPDGILTKDGKHVISYDVLKTERQQRQEAIREAEELKAEIERLKNTPNQVDLSALSVMSAEQLADLKEYFPEQYEAIVSQQTSLLAAQQKLNQVEQMERQRQAEQLRQTQLTVQEEIDNNPTLSHWQRNNPDAFDFCVQQDNMLRDNPKTAGLPLSERFAKAVAIASQIYESPINTDSKEIDVKEKVPPSQSKATKPLINSLSDIPGGEPIEASEKQKLEDSSAAELGNRFMKMTDDQRQAFLNSLG